MAISNYIPICDAIVLLIKPLVEVVIHDLESDKIHYINGNLSKRSVGDSSFLKDTEIEKNVDEVVYPKTNFDGRIIKSISIPIERKWLICINCDVSIFNNMKKLSELFLNNRAEQPISLFKNDWQEKLHVAIHTFLSEKNWNFNELSGYQKKEITKHLFESGAFYEKNAADYVAHVMQMGRATIFKYLKEWRK